MFFLVLSKIIWITTTHSSGVILKITFPIMDEVIPVRAMPEFLHQDCVKLTDYGRAPKHNCVLKPLCSITAFWPTSLNTCLKWKIKKTFKEVNETVTISPPTNMCFQMWSNKWRCKKINMKTSFEAKFSLWKCLFVPQRSFVLLSFYGGLLVISWFFKKIKCPYLGASHIGCHHILGSVVSIYVEWICTVGIYTFEYVPIIYFWFTIYDDFYWLLFSWKSKHWFCHLIVFLDPTWLAKDNKCTKNIFTNSESK